MCIQFPPIQYVEAPNHNATPKRECGLSPQENLIKKFFMILSWNAVIGKLDELYCIL